MDATDDGWGIVAQPLEAAAVPAARRGRGRPRKSTQPVEVPVAAGSDVRGYGTGSVVQRFIELGGGLLESIGSLFQRRLWRALCRNVAAPAIIDKKPQDNPAAFLVERTPLLNISTQQQLMPKAGSRDTLSLDEKRVASCCLPFLWAACGVYDVKVSASDLTGGTWMEVVGSCEAQAL